MKQKKQDMSREEHLRQMKSVEQELQNTTSEYRKRDLRKRRNIRASESRPRHAPPMPKERNTLSPMEKRPMPKRASAGEKAPPNSEITVSTSPPIPVMSVETSRAANTATMEKSRT